MPACTTEGSHTRPAVMARASAISRRLVTPFMIELLSDDEFTTRPVTASCSPLPTDVSWEWIAGADFRAKYATRGGRALATMSSRARPPGGATGLVGAGGRDAGLGHGGQPHETGRDGQGQHDEQAMCECFHDDAPLGW